MTYADIETQSFGQGEEGKNAAPSGMARAWHAQMGGLKATYNRLVQGNALHDLRIEQLLDPVVSAHADNTTNWAIPNEIEILLLRLMPERELNAELESALATADRIAVPARAGLRRLAEAATLVDDKQAVLATLLRETHNRYAARRSERVARHLVANRMTTLGFALTGAIVAVFVILGTGWFAEAVEKAPFTDLVKYNLCVTTFFGFLGAYLSRLIAFQNTASLLSFDELENGYSWHFLMVRLLVGGLSSVIVYFIISGNLIGGELFPEPQAGGKGGFGSLWTANGGDGMVYEGPSANYAKLIVWCFIAGFSERFLPDRVGLLESRAKSA